MNEEPKFKDIIIDGYSTVYTEGEDNHGKFFFIGIPENAEKNSINLIDQSIDGHMIKEMEYCKADGRIAAIKAYY